jgi:hypothetical protein
MRMRLIAATVLAVREHFCAGTASSYAALSDEQKASLAKSEFQGYSYAGKPHRGGNYANYAGEVVAYCGGEAQPAAPAGR